MSTDTTAPVDYSQDPEKIWKASLLKHQNEVFFMLFFRSDLPKAWDLMRGWIGSLGKASQDALSEITKLLEGAIFGGKFLDPITTIKIFDIVSAHVYECYLTQSGYGIVKTSELKITVEPPKKQINRRESAHL